MCTIHFQRVTPSPSFFLFFLEGRRSIYSKPQSLASTFVWIFKIFFGGYPQQFPHYIRGNCVRVCTQVCMSVCAHKCQYVHGCECMFCSSRWGAVVFPWVMLACLHLETFWSLTPGLRLYAKEGMLWSTLYQQPGTIFESSGLDLWALQLLPACFRARQGDFQPLPKPDN